ncbi:MAG: SurA N-terminal domain-containing protein [Desulfuromonadaceae bacterium]
MRHCCVLLTLLLLWSAAVAQAKVVNRIAAVVNKDIITLYQVDRELEQRQFSQGGLAQLSEAELAALRQQVLPSLIEETLIAQRVEKQGLVVSEEEVEAAIDDVQRQNQLSRDDLIQALSLQGMDYTAYREKLRRQILRYKLLGREIKSKVDVSKQEMLDYFREHIEDYRQKPSVHLARISFSLSEKPTLAEIAGVRDLAQEALGKIRQGEEFFTVLLEYSASQLADGGDMGIFGEGELTPAFEQALAGLEEEQVSDLIETPMGFHILKIVDRQTGSVRQFDAVKDEIAKILTAKKTEEAFQVWSEELRKNADIDIRL